MAVGAITDEDALREFVRGVLRGSDLAADVQAVRSRVAQITVTVKAGVPSDADFAVPADGLIVLDSAGSRLYCRAGGVWKSVVVA